MLSGYKTYIIAALVGVLAIAQYLGLISPTAATMIYGLLTAGGIASVRAAIAKGKK